MKLSKRAQQELARILCVSPAVIKKMEDRRPITTIKLKDRTIVNAEWFWSDPQPKPNGVDQ